MTTFSHTFDTATPAGSDDPAEADDRIQEVKKAIQERLAVEHVFDLTGTEVSHANTGQHTGINCISIINTGALANTGNFTLNTDKFTIDAATGNVVVAGTLNVAGAAEVTGVATLGDASLLKTSAAPTTDPMIANKKYVDDQITAAIAAYVTLSAYTNLDSENNAMLKSHAYLAASGGCVSALVTNENGKYLRGYVGTTNDPAGAGDLIDHSGSITGSARAGISMEVSEGEYFEVTYNGSNTPTIRWKSRGTLSKPVDQD